MTTGPEPNLIALVGVVVSGMLTARLWAVSQLGKRQLASERLKSARRHTNVVEGYTRQ